MMARQHKRVLEQLLREHAKAFFAQEAMRRAEQLGVTIHTIAVGNYRSQWGSCSRRGRLAFNWRLLLGPRWVAEYVVAHEVAHLVEHNHSRRYWAVVEQLYPDYKAARRWLRDHARELTF